MTYGYIRVSTDKQTVENQRFEINRFCEQQNLLVDGWIEETISGTKAYNKRKLGELLECVKEDDLIICAELSRLGRNLFMTGSGGHIIARIFNGPGEQINYVPQTATLNNGEWKTMEKKWNDALSEGKKVEVDIKINYADNLRPTDFDVTYIIKTSDGKIEKTENLFFLN